MMNVVTLRTTLLVLAVLQAPSTSAHPAYNQDLTPVFNFTKNLEHAYQLAKNETRPIFLIVHDTGCKACKSLRPALIESHEMKQLSKDFIMVQSLDNQDPPANALNPDDNFYVPRIIFIGSNGQVFDSIFNTKQPKYKRYYTNAEDVVAGMKKAIDANKEIEFYANKGTEF